VAVTRGLQDAILSLATTVDVWRDGAIMLLAVVVIACLWLYAEGAR
jgi:hypothetical protein